MSCDRYIPPLSGPTPNIPNTISGCNDELKKLESVLAQVHEEMHAGLTSSRREEQMWDAQRIVTQLKVILKTCFAFYFIMKLYSSEKIEAITKTFGTESVR
jgi:hypothetical protein